MPKPEPATVINQEYQQEETEITENRNSLFTLSPSVEAFSELFGAPEPEPATVLNRADIDANSSIAANVSGALYVYPNNPVALNVLVDQAFNLRQVGATAAYLLNSAASPITVSLTAPETSSYYATICWNPTTNTASVIYGATAVTPTPIMPDDADLVPLAFVLLTTGQSTVVASNIYAARSWIQPVPIRLFNNAAATNQTLNCNGASNVVADIRFSAAIALNLTNLAGALNFAISGSTPSGVAYTIVGKTAACSDWVQYQLGYGSKHRCEHFFHIVRHYGKPERSSRNHLGHLLEKYSSILSCTSLAFWTFSRKRLV